MQRKEENKPERVFGLQVRCMELDIFKILGIFWNSGLLVEFFGDFLGGFFLRNYFGGFFWRIFLGDIFWEKFFGRFFWEDFFRRIFWEKFFVRNSL